MCVHPCYRNKLAWSRESSCQEKSLKEKLGVAEQHLGERDRTGDGEDFSLSLVSSLCRVFGAGVWLKPTLAPV